MQIRPLPLKGSALSSSALFCIVAHHWTIDERARLRDEGTAHNSIRDADIKFGVAVDAGYVLTFFLGGSTLHGHMDILSDFAVRAFKARLIGSDSDNALQRRNQFLTGFGFANEAMRPRFRTGLELRVVVDCKEHYLR